MKIVLLIIEQFFYIIINIQDFQDFFICINNKLWIMILILRNIYIALSIYNIVINVITSAKT